MFQPNVGFLCTLNIMMNYFVGVWMSFIGVFKSKPIQNKTANQLKKTENRKKPNIFGCVWMLFWKNRYDRIGFRIAFSKPNRTKPNRKSKFLYLFIILLVLYIALIYFLLVFNLIYNINLIYIITTSSISNIINHFHCVMLTF